MADFHWIVPGRLAAIGKPPAERKALNRLVQQLRDHHRITALVVGSREDWLRDAVAATPLESYQHVPLTGDPDAEIIGEVLWEVDYHHTHFNGGATAVYFEAGLGSVWACALLRRGATLNAALNTVRVEQLGGADVTLDADTVAEFAAALSVQPTLESPAAKQQWREALRQKKRATQTKPDFTQPTAGLDLLLHQHVMASMEKQLRLLDMADRAGPWHFALDEGVLRFANGLALDAQLLGTESHTPTDASWLWGWANPTPNLSAMLLESVTDLRSLGMRGGIKEFMLPRLPLGPYTGWLLGLVAAGVCQADGFYSAPTGPDSRLVLLVWHPELKPDGVTLDQIRQVVAQTLQTVALKNHSQAFESYLRYHGRPYRVEARRVISHLADGTPFVAEFDEQSRFVKFEEYSG